MSPEMHPLRTKASDFLTDLESQRRLQPSSLALYRLELSTLLDLAPTPRSEAALKAHLSSKSPATHLRKLTIWRSFLKQCPSPWNLLLAKSSSPKLRRTEPAFLTDQEAFQLETACYHSRNSSRDRLFVALGLQLGLRLNEILQLRYSHFESDWLRITRKGGKQQRLPLTKSLQALFKFLKEEKHASPDDYVFEGRSGGPMTARNAQKKMKSLLKVAGINKALSPHALRHTFATTLAARGVNLAALKELLGHERLTTTEKYLHVTPEHLREALENLNY